MLIAVLQATGHRDLAQAAEGLERFLSLPAEQTGVGEPWEERNIRIPVEPTHAPVAGLRDSLKAAGLGFCYRSHLTAASLILRGSATPEEARELMAQRRAEAFRRALAADGGTVGRRSAVRGVARGMGLPAMVRLP